MTINSFPTAVVFVIMTYYCVNISHWKRIQRFSKYDKLRFRLGILKAGISLPLPVCIRQRNLFLVTSLKMYGHIYLVEI